MTRSINAISLQRFAQFTFSITARTRQLEVLLVNRASRDFKATTTGRISLRQAIAYAINRSELISSAYQEYGDRRLYPDSFRHLANESTIRDIYDPLMYASLLDSAGPKLADDGNRFKDGKKMEASRIARLRRARFHRAHQRRQQDRRSAWLGRRRYPGLRRHVVARIRVQTKLVSGDYSIAMCGLKLLTCPPDPGFTLTSTASKNYTRYRCQRHERPHHPENLRKRYTADSYKNAMSAWAFRTSSKFEQDQPYICLYWPRSAVSKSEANLPELKRSPMYATCIASWRCSRGIENYWGINPI